MSVTNIKTIGPSFDIDKTVIVVIDALRYDFAFSSFSQMKFLQSLTSDLSPGPKGNGKLEQQEGRFSPPSSPRPFHKGCSWPALAHPPTVTLPRIKALTSGGVPGFLDVVMNFASDELKTDNIITQLVPFLTLPLYLFFSFSFSFLFYP